MNSNVRSAEDLKALFNQMDTNHDGLLDPQEFSAGLKILGITDGASRIANIVDGDSDGMVDLDEFIAFFKAISREDLLMTANPGFAAALKAQFPNAMQYEEALVKITSVLAEEGFSQETAIPLVSQCRDEMTSPLFTAVDALWGQVFNISSLAGMVFCGKTGFGAAMHHAPQDAKGEERYVFFVGPHIAIDSDGTVGKCSRPGREAKSGACGALMAFHGEMTQGKVNVAIDHLDFEQTLLKQQLISYMPYGQVPSLVELTKCAHDAIVQSVKDTIRATLGDNSPHKWAIASGVLVHGPSGSNFFWPAGLEVSDSKESLLPRIFVQSEKFDAAVGKFYTQQAGDLFQVVTTRSAKELAAHLLSVNLSHINTPDALGSTCLHAASSTGKHDSISTLVQHGANVAARDNRGFTAADVAFSRMHFATAVFLAKEYKCFVSPSLVLQRVFRHAALGELKEVQALVNASADPSATANLKNFSGLSLLESAKLHKVEGVRDELVAFLTSAGATA